MTAGTLLAAYRATVARLLLGLVAAAGLVLLGGVAPAAAHTELVGVTPAGGEQVSLAAPLTVTLTFTEAIDPQFATVVVVDAADAVAPSASTSVAGATVSHVLTDVLAPGEYAIRYRVVSGDGHPVDGESGFTVLPAAAAPTDAAPTDAAPTEAAPTEETTGAAAPQQEASEPAAATEADGGGPGLGLAVGALALTGLVTGGAVVARRRRAAGTPEA